MTDLIRLQPEGLVGPGNRFHIDAWGQAAINLITHAHGDHARAGSAEYWCAEPCAPILRHRLGPQVSIRALPYRKPVRLDDCWISFHPAGHILGSAQIRVEQGSRVWVVTGDYKRDSDPTCELFEPVPCDTMITEATFGLPIYRWASARSVTARIVDWWQKCREEGVTALLFCYALGKAQRILAELTHFTQDEVLLHGAVATLTQIYREQGVSMVPTRLVSDADGPTEGRLILAPPSAHRSPWMKRFRSVSTAFASGWMAVRGIRRRRGYHRGFVLSDHADWPGLLDTVEESRATRLLVTHGSSDTLARYLREVKGMKADALATHFGEGGRLVQAFAALFEQLDQTTATNEKVRIMTEFFRREDPDTSAWALFFLSGQRPKQLVGSTKLQRWAQEKVGYPDWLMEESYAAVGDTAELIALVLAAADHAAKPEPLPGLSLGDWMERRILPLGQMDDQARCSNILDWWTELNSTETFMLNKLLTGSLRVGVSETLVYRALAAALSLTPSVIAARLVASWQPSAEFFLRLGAPAEEAQEGRGPDTALLPHPFCLAAPMEGDPEGLGDASEWQCEWKWDGIRCQIVKAGSGLEIWSRGEERITGSFPDLARVLLAVPGEWVIDGEIVAGDWHRPGSFQSLQRRLNRKNPSAALIASYPVSFLAYDLLQADGHSQRHHPLSERRAMLEEMLQSCIGERLGISPLLMLSSWDQARRLRESSRSQGAEGLMLKAKDSEYVTGRKRGVWFKWKIDPLAIDAVLTAAQPGTGRRASLYTDYTFSVWSGDSLIPIAKAYSGLTDEEIRELDGWIRKHTRERFGPVRAVETQRVFEIGFEGISRSDRHKSGFALRFPRILRERTDKRVEDADHVATLETLLGSLGSSAGKSRRDRPAGESSPDSQQLRFELGT